MPVSGSMDEQAVGTPAASASSTGRPKPSNEDGIDERPGARVEIVEILARNPAGKLDAAGESQRLAQGVQVPAVKKPWMPHTIRRNSGWRSRKIGEGAQQAVQVLVRVQRGDGEQEGLGLRGARRARRNAGRRRRESARTLAGGRRYQRTQIGARGVGIGQDQARDVRGPEEEELPERQIEPAEVLGVAFVLQVVEDGDLAGSRRSSGAVKPGLNSTSSREARGGQRQGGLFPEQARGPGDGAHGLRHVSEVRLLRDQVGAGLAVGEDEVLVDGIDFGERGEQSRADRFRCRRRRPESGRAR